jgi:hypothetical protein
VSGTNSGGAVVNAAAAAPTPSAGARACQNPHRHQRVHAITSPALAQPQPLALLIIIGTGRPSQRLRSLLQERQHATGSYALQLHTA